MKRKSINKMHLHESTSLKIIVLFMRGALERKKKKH